MYVTMNINKLLLTIVTIIYIIGLIMLFSDYGTEFNIYNDKSYIVKPNIYKSLDTPKKNNVGHILILTALFIFLYWLIPLFKNDVLRSIEMKKERTIKTKKRGKDQSG